MLSDIVTLTQIETELKKRCQFAYHWGRFQNDVEDSKTNFIYEILYFEDLMSEIRRKFQNHHDYEALTQYSLNRWYNFWSATAVERIFTQSSDVKANPDSKDRYKDFEIKGIPFDHKSSVFPKSYPHSIEFAIENPEDLITWFYTNQSQQKRQHFKNRLFIVFFHPSGAHWKLKAELTWLQSKIEEYLAQFKFENLKNMYVHGQNTALSDIIWAIHTL